MTHSSIPSPFIKLLRVKSGAGVGQRVFIGQYFDDATALSYLNARYYSGDHGQFLSQDPILLGVPVSKILTNPQRLNYYSYALDNPINYSDPNGEAATIEQQIASLTLQVQVLQRIVELYKTGAATQANAAYARYQNIAGGGAVVSKQSIFGRRPWAVLKSRSGESKHWCDGEAAGVPPDAQSSARNP